MTQLKKHLQKSVAILILTFPLLSLADWQTTNVQFLRGNGYKLGTEDKTIMTFEHADD